MKKILLLFFLLSGCSTLASPTATYGCQTADAATTLYALHLGAVEANPLMHSLLAFGGAPAFIAFKIGVAYLVTKVPSETVRAGANIVGCGAAAHNLLLFM